MLMLVREAAAEVLPCFLQARLRWLAGVDGRNLRKRFFQKIVVEIPSLLGEAEIRGDWVAGGRMQQRQNIC